MRKAFRIVAGLSGAIIALESLALLLGTHAIAHRPGAAVPKNTSLIVLDVLGGAWLVCVACEAKCSQSPRFSRL